MAKLKVLALTSHALYSAGVISRLEQYRDQLDLIRVDVETADVIQVIEKHRPNAVIIDTNFVAEVAHCPLDEFVRKVPTIKMIRLDPGREGFNILTSEQVSASAVKELLAIITADGPAS